MAQNMNQPSGNKSFFDRSTIIGLIVITIFFFGWEYYMRIKYPPQAANQTTGQTTGQIQSTTQTPAVAQTANGEAKAGNPAEQSPSALNAPTVAPDTAVAEQFVEYSSSSLSFQVSSKGMGLKAINLLAYKTRDEKPIMLGLVQENYPFATQLVGSEKPLDFKVERTAENVFTGTAVSGAMTIVKTMTIDPSKYAIDVDVKVSGATADFKGVVTYLSEALNDAPKPSMFSGGATFDSQDIYYRHEGTKTDNLLHRSDGFTGAEKNVDVAALSSHYFTLAFVNRADIAPRVEVTIPANSPVASARLIHQPVNPTSDFTVKYAAYAGPKQLAILESVDEGLGTVIQYGMFAIIAKPLLSLLKFLNSFLFNYGWSIVLLTIIVRILVLPFNIYSFKSMKAMQKIQPEMQRLKEKYKNDPQTMNREVMQLMKTSGANPIGGCLPMLLQIPVFFALYQVLGQSIELYRAPWMLWIQDLSVRDPFYVLPIAMGIAMFVQQKITPTAMDPAQRKILLAMPVVFSFFMLSLPSGLTLYIFVSTIFGIVQQYALMRDKNPEAKVSQVQA